MLFIGFMMFGLFELLFTVLFFTFFITAIVKMVKRVGSSQSNTTTYTSNNMTVNHQPGSKYNTINSHYSQETLNGTRQTTASKDTYGMPIQPAYNGTFRTDYEESNAHNHAYEHKVEPIGEASVHEIFDERKQAYRERKAEMKADLPKSSYSVVEEKIKKSSGGKYQNIQEVFAKNGDNGSPVYDNEENISCTYCGAKNILPRYRSVAYKCYFCRQEL